jgi:cytochrome d ubiquinol oxidase subunit II
MVLFWISVLALSVLLYVVLDGFDLGIGILFGFTRLEERRRILMSSVAPIWDGNETWLVVAIVVLWGAFPVVYSVLFSALYLPVLFMLAGLILRGVAFEFRNKAHHSRWVWNVAFSGGSFLAAFMQGLMVGALVQGLPVAHGQYVGGEFEWLSLFAVLCGIGLCLSYALAGACWLILKCEGDTRRSAYRLVPVLSVASAAVLVLLLILALEDNLRVMARWLERPYLFVFPLLGVAAAIALGVSVYWRRDRVPFLMVNATLAAAIGTVAITFWPYMIPFSITVEEAAAPHSSLAFMFWGEGLFVLPLMLAFTVISYRVFRGKVDLSSQGYH